MIDFKEEIARYEPALEVEDIEDAVISGYGAEDVIEMLRHITKLVEDKR